MKRKRRTVQRVLHPAKEQVVDLARFKPDLVDKDWKRIFKLGGTARSSSLFFHPIETLTPIKTVGLGMAYLYLEMATRFTTFGQPPFAGFDQSITPYGRPAVLASFQPFSFGITTISSFVVTFFLEVTGQSTFDLSGSGSHLISEVVGGGSKVLSGQVAVSVIVKRVLPADNVWGSVVQTSGGPWKWYATRLTLPPVVLSL